MRKAEAGNAGEVCVVKGSSLTVGGLLAIRKVETKDTLGTEIEKSGAAGSFLVASDVIEPGN